MNYLSYRIALYKFNKKRRKVSEAIYRFVEEARRAGGETKAQEVSRAESFNLDVIDHEILGLVTRYLINKANKRFLPLPYLSEEERLWEQSNFTGKYHLTDKGITEIRKMIRKDKKERMEILSYWASLLIGLIGAVTGLVAVIRR